MKLAPKLIIIVSSMTLIAVILSATVSYFTTSRALQNQASKSQLEIAQQTMDKVDRFLFERHSDIHGLSEREQFETFLAGNRTTSATAVNSSLKDYQQFNHFWTEINLLDAKGNALAGTDPERIGKNMLADNQVLTDIYKKALSGKAASSDIFYLQSHERHTLIFMEPVFNNTKVSGVIMGEVDWTDIAGILDGVKDAEAMILNNEGKLIVSNQSGDHQKILTTDYSQTETFKKISSNPSSSQLLPGLRKPTEQSVISHVYQSGFSEYTGNGWHLLVSSPARVALAPAQQLAMSLVAILVSSITIIILAILYLLNRQIIRPIAALSSAVNRISLGDLSQTVAVASRDEIGALSQNFNEMTRQLAATHRRLESTSQEATERRAQLESSINGLRQGFILTDTKGSIVMANAAAHEIIHDKSDKDSLSLNAITKALPADTNLADRIKETLKERRSTKLPTLPLGGRFLNLYITPVINEDASIGCVLLLEDVTEERIMQRSRDEFFSIASHELRTPLTAIRGNTTLIREYFPEAIKDPSMKEMVADIHDSAVRLIEIVNDFLDASRLEQNKMKFTLEAFPVESVIEKVIYEMSSLSRDKGLFLTFDQHTLGKIPMVYADQNRIKQIIYNLVGNAMKFTEKGGVTINCLREGKNLKVCVSDTGPGISAEGQQILFHKFQQTGESILTRDNTRGTGLGLYISKLLIEHMGGSIQLEHSEVGKGTTFSFTIPLASDPQVKEAETKAAQLKAASAINNIPVPAAPVTAAPVADKSAPAPPSSPALNVVVKAKTPHKKSSPQVNKDV